jgi:hypothetical protein
VGSLFISVTEGMLFFYSKAAYVFKNLFLLLHFAEHFPDFPMAKSSTMLLKMTIPLLQSISSDPRM